MPTSPARPPLPKPQVSTKFGYDLPLTEIYRLRDEFLKQVHGVVLYSYQTEFADAILQPTQLVLELAGLEHAAYGGEDAITRERLLDDVTRTLAHRLDGLGDRAVARQDENIR